MLDSSVAEIYGVETKRINEAVKNNPDKFPKDYMFELNELEFIDLRSKISSAKFSKTRVSPKAFTEKGLYMIATILRSKQPVDATFAIIETFSKIRELSR
ncbi:MAG: ORF6N domain-containing protein, partial [Chlorobium sp.]